MPCSEEHGGTGEISALSELTVSIPVGAGYVLTVLHAPMPRAITARYLPEVKRLGETLTNPAFLPDARGAPDLRGNIEDYEIHELAKWFGIRGAKIAVVVEPGDRSYDFTDTVANDAGHCHRLFTVEAEAQRWLEKDT